MSEKMKYEKILNKIEEMSKDIQNIGKEIVEMKTILKSQSEKHSENKKDIEENRKRIRALENWRWLVIGFSMAISIAFPIIINKFL